MAAKKATPEVPVTPATPPAPSVKVEKELPPKMNVRHKKSGQEFEVSKAFFEANKQVLDII